MSKVKFKKFDGCDGSSHVGSSHAGKGERMSFDVVKFEKAAPKATQKRRKTDAGLNTESESNTCQNCRRQRKNRRREGSAKSDAIATQNRRRPQHGI